MENEDLITFVIDEGTTLQPLLLLSEVSH